MFRKVVVATHLSEESIAVLHRLGGLKAYGVERCVLLLCLGVQETASLGLSYSVERLEQSLRFQEEILAGHGFSVEARVTYGDTIGEVNRAAREESCSAIVIGGRTTSMIGELLFGGIADNVIQRAQKPVFVVRVESEHKAESAPDETVDDDLSSHVLFPTDFSENADVAFAYVRAMALSGVNKITLAHIQDKVRISPYLDSRLQEFNTVDQGRLDTLQSSLKKESAAEVDTVIAYGSPVVEIIKLVKERDVKLVVMGNQGRGFVQELFLGSVSNNIARLSPSSVLLIPINR